MYVCNQNHSCTLNTMRYCSVSYWRHAHGL